MSTVLIGGKKFWNQSSRDTRTRRTGNTFEAMLHSQSLSFTIICRKTAICMPSGCVQTIYSMIRFDTCWLGQLDDHRKNRLCSYTNFHIKRPVRINRGKWSQRWGTKGNYSQEWDLLWITCVRSQKVWSISTMAKELPNNGLKKEICSELDPIIMQAFRIKSGETLAVCSGLQSGKFS